MCCLSIVSRQLLASLHFRFHQKVAQSSKMTASKATTSAAAEASRRLFRQLAQSRRSTRRFDPSKTIEPAALRSILQSTRTAPSGFNLQPAHALLVRDPAVKDRLASEAMLGLGNQYRTRDCAAMAVFVADLEISRRIPRIVELEKAAACRDPNYLAVLPVAASFLTGEGHAATLFKQLATSALSPVQPMPSIEAVESWSYKNAALSAMMYTLAAHSQGLGTCMMEGYDVRRAREVLRVPDRYAMPLMVATGYTYAEEKAEGGSGGYDEDAMPKTPRLEMEEMFFGDTFGASLDDVLNCHETEEDS